VRKWEMTKNRETHSTTVTVSGSVCPTKGLITWAGLCQFAGITARLLNTIKINFAITWQPGQGPFSRKTGNVSTRKAIFSPSVSWNGEVYTPETSCMKWTSVHIKSMRIKHFCNRKVRDFSMAFRGRKVSGAFEKRAPAQLAEIPVRRARDPR